MIRSLTLRLDLWWSFKKRKFARSVIRHAWTTWRRKMRDDLRGVA